MFGMGLPELAVIAIVAVFVFGPDRLPEMAKQAGAFVRKGRKFALAARDELRTELGPEFADLELADLDPRQIVRKHILDAIDEDSPVGDPLAPPVLERLPVGEVPPFDTEAT